MVISWLCGRIFIILNAGHQQQSHIIPSTIQNDEIQLYDIDDDKMCRLKVDNWTIIMSVSTEI